MTEQKWIMLRFGSIKVKFTVGGSTPPLPLNTYTRQFSPSLFHYQHSHHLCNISKGSYVQDTNMRPLPLTLISHLRICESLLTVLCVWCLSPLQQSWCVHAVPCMTCHIFVFDMYSGSLAIQPWIRIYTHQSRHRC